MGSPLLPSLGLVVAEDPSLTERLSGLLLEALPALVVLALMVVGLPLAHRSLLGRRATAGTAERLPRQLALVVLTLFGLVLLVLALPMETATRGQVLSLAGIAFTAVVTLASTTFVANAMAGLMLRTIRSFRAGDWVRVEGTFGRVTERGLFHVEVQTEDRDLVTLPNMTLVTSPVKVVRATGTMVSATLSLGYDVPRRRIEDALKEGAAAAGLRDAYVHVLELGDFAVTYLVAGFLEDLERLLTTRSRLRGEVIDHLHGAGIEIVSPAFMNQRRLDPSEPVVPVDTPGPRRPRPDQPVAEEVAFDKASRAAALEGLRDERSALAERLAKGADPAPTDDERPGLEGRLAELDARIAELEGGLHEA